VRGSEAIRTRVVQAGALDLVAQILESWLKQHGVAIFAGPLGSQIAVDAAAAGMPVPGTETRRRTSRAGTARHAHATSSSTIRASTISQFVSSLTGGRSAIRAIVSDSRERDIPQNDTDVDMADAESTDGASLSAADDSMDVDEPGQEGQAAPSGTSTTPRASHALLPMAISIPPRPVLRETPSQASSAGNSLSGDDSNAIPRTISDNSLLSSVTVQLPRPGPLHLGAPRIPQLAQDPVSNQSSPMGTPTRNESVEGMRAGGRRGTIVGRPVNVNLAVRNERRREAAAGSGTSDGGEDVDLPTATIAAGIAAANAQAMESGGTVVPDEPGPPPNVEIVETETGAMVDDPDPEMMAAEQARLDMEAGAPPGQPGAVQTPRIPTVENAIPRDPLIQPAANPQQAQIIIANGAPRGFQDLGSYVGISSLLNPDGDRYSDDSILLALQLLAYLSKYPHVRAAFHHPRRPMHPTFDYGEFYAANPLPERPGYSETPNIFSLVERFTFRPSPSDPMLFRIPQEIQYWAGVIMRNACRKDEAQGGIRQCANMSCGRWESFPREFAKCRRCRKAKYCSKECQSRAWSEGHRFWCNVRSEGDPGAAPGPGGGGGFPPGGGPAGAGDDDDDMDFPHADLPHGVIERARAAQTGNVRQVPAGGPIDALQRRALLTPTPETSRHRPMIPDPQQATSPRSAADEAFIRQLIPPNRNWQMESPHILPYRPRVQSSRIEFSGRRTYGPGTLVNRRPIEIGAGTVFAPPPRQSPEWPMQPFGPTPSNGNRIYTFSPQTSSTRGRPPPRSTISFPSHRFDAAASIAIPPFRPATPTPRSTRNPGCSVLLSSESRTTAAYQGVGTNALHHPREPVFRGVEASGNSSVSPDALREVGLISIRQRVRPARNP